MISAPAPGPAAAFVVVFAPPPPPPDPTAKTKAVSTLDGFVHVSLEVYGSVLIEGIYSTHVT
jgi:hypothetical protein